MTLAQELIYAILSMDAYNRGYNASIILPDNTNGSVQIGNAAITDNSTEALGNGVDSAIGFYALAYDTNNDGVADIISYRGTDYPAEGQVTNDPIAGSFDVPNDIYHGWTLGAGNLDSEQGMMAIEFYQAVAGAGNYFASGITLTGHSLGGGLAGFVGANDNLESMRKAA